MKQEVPPCNMICAANLGGGNSHDGLYKLDTICTVSKELRSEKEILKNILADNTIDTIPNLREKENKLKDLSFIFNFLISMP